MDIDAEDNNKGEKEVEDDNAEEPEPPLPPLAVVRFIIV